MENSVHNMQNVIYALIIVKLLYKIYELFLKYGTKYSIVD